ncbi:MAG: DUF58 domain-containing protein [Betaproteobacteria bacterium]|nr:DUF58 domain-containing protein [Betaproteobacteria bacterium]
MPIPSLNLLALCAAWCALATLAAFFPTLRPLCWWAGAGVLLIALFDLAWSIWERMPGAVRQHAGTLALGAPARVTLLFSWAGQRRPLVKVFDHLPLSCASEMLPAQLRLSCDAPQQLRYRMKPMARGEHHFGPIVVRVRSPWALWWRQHATPCETSIRVFPDFSAIARHALQATSSSTARTGVLKRRRRGEGLDFDQLREYRIGDSPRRIDWKASRRFDKLISREYQDERDQRILLLVDCGRRMGAREAAGADDAAPLSHFDHALDALLLLAHVGLHHGDAVGLMTLGGHSRRLTPKKSVATLSRILHAVYDLQPTLEASDFEQAAQALLRLERKRSLVVILTNLRDEDDAGLLAACRLLGRHHLVLVASLREQALDEACGIHAEDAETLALRAAALEYRERRMATLRRLRQSGVLCLDVQPQELAVATINRYLAIKAEGRL